MPVCTSLRVNRLTRGLDHREWIVIASTEPGLSRLLSLQERYLLGGPAHKQIGIERFVRLMVDITKHGNYEFEMNFEGKGPFYNWGTWNFSFRRPMRICPDCELPFYGHGMCSTCKEEHHVRSVWGHYASARQPMVAVSESVR